MSETPETIPLHPSSVDAIKEQLHSQSTDFYGSMTAMLYDEVVKEHDLTSWEAAHEGVCMWAIANHDIPTATAAIQLMRSPSHKWHAAVWAAKQGYGHAWPEWQAELGMAKAAAEESSSWEMFQIGLAELEMTLYGADRTTKEGEAQYWHAVGNQLAVLESIAQNSVDFPREYYKISSVDRYRLEAARLLRDYKEFGYAKQLRKQCTTVPGPILKQFDESFMWQQAGEKDIVGWFRRQRGYQPDVSKQMPRNLIRRSSRTDHYDGYAQQFQPSREEVRDITRDMGVYDAAWDLDMLLRAEAMEQAFQYYEKMSTGLELFGWPRTTAGTRLQASVLMQRAGMSQLTAETEVDLVNLMGALWQDTYESPHATIIERHGALQEAKAQYGQALGMVTKVADVATRASLLTDLHTIGTERGFTDGQDEFTSSLVHALVACCRTWQHMLPADTRRAVFLSEPSPLTEMVVAQMREEEAETAKRNREHDDFMRGMLTLLMGPEERSH